MNLTYTLWQEVACKCPVECEISHITSEDYKDATDEYGNPVKRATHNFVKGTLTVEEVQHGWNFYHPGIKGGKIFIHALNGDTTPGPLGIHIR